MIRIQNIYYMLSYAFQVLNEQGYKLVATEEFDNVAELCAAILIKGVSLQIKRGLGKEYVLQTESLSALRGKIDIISFANLLYKIDLDDKDKKLLYKTFKKNKKMLKALDVRKKDFSIEMIDAVEEALSYCYQLKEA